MTDGRPRRSSRYGAGEQAALDLKAPWHSIFPPGADGSSPSTVSSVAAATRWKARFRGATPDLEQSAPSAAPMTAYAQPRNRGQQRLVTFRRAQRVRRWLERAGRIRVAPHRTPAKSVLAGVDAAAVSVLSVRPR
jgi:hypothetical protein